MLEREGTVVRRPVPFFLRRNTVRLLLLGGKGGVGKTTCATSIALRLGKCSSDSSFLLVSTDPAHSLLDSLADFPAPRNLNVLELNAEESLRAFKDRHREDLREIASRGTFLDDEDIGKFLDLFLPGLDEIMAFLEISRWAENGDYDCIVVDTAPTGHTLKLLAMPELMRKWLGALDVLLAKHRYMKQVFTGAYQRDKLDRFLLDLSASITNMVSLLQNPAYCRFVPVTVAETLSVCETLTLLQELRSLKVPVTDIVVNRLYSESDCPVCSDRRSRQMNDLQRLELSKYTLWGVPMYPREVRGSDLLETFWEGAAPLDVSILETGKPRFRLTPSPPQVEDPPNALSPSINLLLFAGKGGVGKTTLACASALRISRDFPAKKVLLFSADPAHSLSCCLDQTIGPDPRTLAPGLTAMEIDAQAEFEALKGLYAEEIAAVIEAISPNLDLAFDREVMERIMDLSPPGLDEIMAITVAMKFLAEGAYDVLVLDSAPTGHLIRLLETPEILAQWLKLFFDLFLKYRRIFVLSSISKRLVQMSKDLKLLREVLEDQARTALFVVTIPTEMAFQETQDLVVACEHVGIAIPTLFLNLVTPAGQCGLCSALQQRELMIRREYQEAYPQKHQALVYTHGEPRGLQQLWELGEVLYKPVPQSFAENRRA
jgi:arsenite-transporting ATPase